MHDIRKGLKLLCGENLKDISKMALLFIQAVKEAKKLTKTEYFGTPLRATNFTQLMLHFSLIEILIQII